MKSKQKMVWKILLITLVLCGAVYAFVSSYSDQTLEKETLKVVFDFERPASEEDLSFLESRLDESLRRCDLEYSTTFITIRPLLGGHTTLEILVSCDFGDEKDNEMQLLGEILSYSRHWFEGETTVFIRK